jgi:diguanylate cyclase (GGDEF)-like protein
VSTPNSKLERLLQLSHKIHSTLEVDKALEIVLDAALELTDMQRGFIMLLNAERELEFRLGRDNTARNLTRDEFQVSHTIIDKAVQQQKLFYFVGPSQLNTESVVNLRIGSGFCVPLFAYRGLSETGECKKMIGILYEDSKRITRFGKEEEDIVNSLGLHAGLALENAQLYELATLDGLTRIFQRRYFDSVAALEWERARRHKRPISILLGDLDHFKTVNDRFGHDRGDIVLAKTAQLIKGACRLEDVVARFGGEEFIILLPETDLDGAQQVAVRIQQALSVLPEQDMITISIGAASHPSSSAASIEQLIKYADLALYEAKRSGRNKVVAYVHSDWPPTTQVQ